MDTHGEYLPRLVALPDGETIPLVGTLGEMALAACFEDVPLAAVAMDAQESAGWLVAL